MGEGTIEKYPQTRIDKTEGKDKKRMVRWLVLLGLGGKRPRSVQQGGARKHKQIPERTTERHKPSNRANSKVFLI